MDHGEIRGEELRVRPVLRMRSPSIRMRRWEAISSRPGQGGCRVRVAARAGEDLQGLGPGNIPVFDGHGRDLVCEGIGRAYVGDQRSTRFSFAIRAMTMDSRVSSKPVVRMVPREMVWSWWPHARPAGQGGRPPAGIQLDDMPDPADVYPESMEEVQMRVWISPRLNRSSASTRTSFERDPWWTSTSPVS